MSRSADARQRALWVDACAVLSLAAAGGFGITEAVWRIIGERSSRFDEVYSAAFTALGWAVTKIPVRIAPTRRDQLLHAEAELRAAGPIRMMFR